MRLVLLLVSTFCAFAADQPIGAELYKRHCASCHEAGANTRIPPTATLRQISAATITKALTVGVMRQQAEGLSDVQRMTIARWLGRNVSTSVSIEELPNRCASPSPLRASASAWAAWGLGLDNRRFQTLEAAGIKPSDIPRLKLKWAFGFADTTLMRSQPAVYGGRVFAGGNNGTVYSLDAATGCVHWVAEGAAGVRTGLVVVRLEGRTMIFFGDSAGQVYALDANTGKSLWQLQPDDHPLAIITGTPAYHDGRLYVGVSSYEEATTVTEGYVCCTFRGSLLAVDAATGAVLWKTYTIAETPKPGKPTQRGADTIGPSGAAIWSSPTLDPDHGVVYVNTGDNYSDPTTATSDAVLALSMDDGQLLWSQQMTEGDAYNVTCTVPDKAACPDSDGPDFDFGSPPILVRLDAERRALILPQKSGVLHAVDPDQEGRILWQSRVGHGGTLGGIQWGSASDGDRVYVALSDLRYTRTRQPDTGAVFTTLNPEEGGGLFAFDVENGELLWNTPPPGCGNRSQCSPAQSAAVSGIPGVVFSGSVDGHLRGYSTDDGDILWDYDTVREFTTVNAVPGKGGSMDGGGAVIADGLLVVGSGYPRFGGLPGNVLLVFSVDGL